MAILFSELLLIFIIMIIILLMVLSILKNKVYKTKEEYLILSNQICSLLILFLLFIYNILLFYFENIENDHNSLIIKIYYYILNYSFDVYIIFLFANNYMIILDYYYTYTYPLHFFSYVLKISKNIKNFHTKFFIWITIIMSLFDISYCEIKYVKEFLSKIPIIKNISNFYLFQCNEFDDDNSENSFPFIITNSYRGFILIIINFVTIMHILFLFPKVGNFSFNKNKLLKKNLRIKLYINLVYLIYAISVVVVNGDIAPLLNEFFILILILVHNIAFILNYSSSKFVQFKLGKSLVNLSIVLIVFVLKIFFRKTWVIFE